MESETEIYQVQSGESLSSIARDVLGDIELWPTLAYVNSIQHPYWIKPGQILQLPRRDEVILNVTAPSVAATEVRAQTNYSPATVIVLAVVAALLFIK